MPNPEGINQYTCGVCGRAVENRVVNTIKGKEIRWEHLGGPHTLRAVERAHLSRGMTSIAKPSHLGGPFGDKTDTKHGTGPVSRPISGGPTWKSETVVEVTKDNPEGINQYTVGGPRSIIGGNMRRLAAHSHEVSLNGKSLGEMRHTHGSEPHGSHPQAVKIHQRDAAKFHASQVQKFTDDFRGEHETIATDGKIKARRNPGDVVVTLTKGDQPGHEFHGNQWTAGAGDKYGHTHDDMKDISAHLYSQHGISTGMWKANEKTPAATTKFHDTQHKVFGTTHHVTFANTGEEAPLEDTEKSADTVVTLTKDNPEGINQYTCAGCGNVDSHFAGAKSRSASGQIAGKLLDHSSHNAREIDEAKQRAFARFPGATPKQTSGADMRARRILTITDSSGKSRGRPMGKSSDLVVELDKFTDDFRGERETIAPNGAIKARRKPGDTVVTLTKDNPEGINQYTSTGISGKWTDEHLAKHLAEKHGQRGHMQPAFGTGAYDSRLQIGHYFNRSQAIADHQWAHNKGMSHDRVHGPSKDHAVMKD